MRTGLRNSGWSLAIGAAAVVAIGAPLARPFTPGAIAQTSTTQCNDGQRRWLEVRNLSRQSIYFIKTRDAWSNNAWSADKLGDTATPSGASVYVSMPAQDCRCRADLEITFEAVAGYAQAVEVYNDVNYCAYGSDPNPVLIVGN